LIDFDSARPILALSLQPFPPPPPRAVTPSQTLIINDLRKLDPSHVTAQPVTEPSQQPALALERSNSPLLVAQSDICGRTSENFFTTPILAIINYPLSIIHYPLSIIHYLLSIIHYPLSIDGPFSLCKMSKNKAHGRRPK
jgi:hypothetical protein